MCSFAERRKLAFGSDSSTFFFAHIRTSGFPSRRVGLSVLCEAQIKKGEHMGQAPTVRVLNDVDETIRELSVCGR